MITKWHFVYFGYSFNEKKAYAYCNFDGKEASKLFNNVNHFLSSSFWVYVGKDTVAKNSYNG